MLQRIPKLLLAAAMIAALTPMGICDEEPVAKSNATGLRAVKDKATVSLFDGERPILRYRYADVPMKPYLDQLFSPKGVQVLRDSPHDHKHHHALMFALAVNGVDFWSEGQGCGKQKHVPQTNPNTTAKADAIRTSFIEQLDWNDPASGKSLLAERREITAVKAPDLGATLVEWRSALQTPPGKDTAVLTGDHFFGLGMRFVQSMDGGRFFNADDKQGKIVRGTERLTPVKWCAYTAKADGHPVTVAMFDHPKNFRYPAKMFTMTKHFAYLSATRNEWKKPITIKAGEPLNLRYGVAVWDGEVDKTTVEKLYQRWLKLSNDK